MNSLVISMHIPKTGGTTLKNILQQAYKNSFLWVTQTNSSNFIKDIIENCDLSLIKCIHGHISYGLHNFIPDTFKYSYFTFIRNPIERLLSFYNFLLKNKPTIETYNYENIFGWNSSTTLLDWLENQRLAGQDNDMTRFFTGMKNLNTDQLRSRITDYDYEIAKRNAHNFIFIGDIDNFDLGIRQLSDLLNWPCIPEYKKENYFPKRIKEKDLTGEEKNLIIKTQKYDIKLYDYIRECGVKNG